METGKLRARKSAAADPAKVEAAIESAKRKIRADGALATSALVKLGMPSSPKLKSAI